MKNTIYLSVFIFALALSSCGRGGHSNSADTGSASFGLTFEQASAPAAIKLAPSMAPADICSSYGITSISGTVYNSSNTVIATGGPWACSAHTGTIYNIPTGSNIRITIKGTVSGSVAWQGETTGATIYSGQDTNVGSIAMIYTGSDTTPPTVSAATPTGTNVPVTSSITVTFSESMASSTIDTTTFTLKNGAVAVSGSVSYNATTKTATFTPSFSLSYSATYTATVSTGVTDMAANKVQSLYTWDFTTEAPPGSAPPSPTGVSATAADKQVTISWTATSGATSYNIYWSNTTGVTKSNGTPITGATSPYIHTALTNGTTYYYVVTAVNSYGESAASSQVSATPQVPAPGAPTGVSATTGDGQVIISWSTVTGATSYKVYWSTTSGSGTGGTAIAVGNVTSYTHTGLTNGMSYYYVVTAVNAGGESAVSGQVSATPQIPASGAPTGVNATAGNTQNTISWAPVTGATSYNIYWSTTTGVTTANGTKITGATSPYTHSALTNWTTYYYIVTAVNLGGESAASAQVGAMPVPPIPAAPTGVAAAAGNTQNTITWGAVTGAVSYNIYWSTTIGVTTATGTKVTGVVSPYTHSALTNGTTYYYIVTAVNLGGESAASAQAGAIPMPPTPAAPAGVAAAAGNTLNTITWGAVTGATSYNIYWSTNIGVTTATGTKITGATSPYTHTGLINWTTYYYIVTAVNLAGESAASSQVSAMPPGLMGGSIQRNPLNLTTVVATFAGSAGVIGSTDGTGTAARFNVPTGITTDGTNLFVADMYNHTIRKMVISTGVVTTFAGSTGVTGSTDGTGTAARFFSPFGITTDGTNLFVAENGNSTIRKIVISTGVVTTIAGSTGVTGSTDGTGTAATFNNPSGITTDGTNLFVADVTNHTIRKIVISTGVVTTIASSAGLTGSTDGTGTVARFHSPSGITTDGTNLFVTDTLNRTIRKILIDTGAVTTLVGSAGLVGASDGTGTTARFNWPIGITSDGTNLFVADMYNHTIRKIVISTGVVTTIAGSAGLVGSTDGTGAAARFNQPYDITTDGINLFVADTYNYTIRKIQ